MILNDYLTIPFSDDGRDRSGCNCWGLFALVYREQLGIELPGYCSTPATNIRGVARNVERDKRQWRLVTPAAGGPRDFDLVIMTAVDRTARTMIEAHVGLFHRGSVLHTERSTGPRFDPLDSPRIRTRIREIRRHVDVAW